LELPYGLQLPNFQENFAYYKESEGRYVLESGSTFSCNLDLVPVVGPPPGIDLPYDILFRINMLVQNGYLAGPTLDNTFYRLVDPCKFGIAHIEHALEKLYQSMAEYTTSIPSTPGAKGQRELNRLAWSLKYEKKGV
jgi:RNA-dependent RNA polymerase